MEEWDNSGHLEGENAQLTAFFGGGMRRYLRFLRGGEQEKFDLGAGA